MISRASVDTVNQLIDSNHPRQARKMLDLLMHENAHDPTLARCMARVKRMEGDFRAASMFDRMAQVREQAMPGTSSVASDQHEYEFDSLKAGDLVLMDSLTSLGPEIGGASGSWRNSRSPDVCDPGDEGIEESGDPASEIPDSCSVSEDSDSAKESVSEDPGHPIMEGYSGDSGFDFEGDSPSETWIVDGVGSDYGPEDFDEAPLDNEDAEETDRVSRDERATQKAIQFLTENSLDNSWFPAIRDVFSSSGWISPRRAIQKNLWRIRRPETILLVLRLREEFRDRLGDYGIPSWADLISFAENSARPDDYGHLCFCLEGVFDHWCDSPGLQELFHYFSQYFAHITRGDRVDRRTDSFQLVPFDELSLRGGYVGGLYEDDPPDLNSCDTAFLREIGIDLSGNYADRLLMGDA